MDQRLKRLPSTSLPRSSLRRPPPAPPLRLLLASSRRRHLVPVTGFAQNVPPGSSQLPSLVQAAGFLHLDNRARSPQLLLAHRSRCSYRRGRHSTLPPHNGAVGRLVDEDKDPELVLKGKLSPLRLLASAHHPGLLPRPQQQGLPLRLLVPRLLYRLPHKSLLQTVRSSILQRSPRVTLSPAWPALPWLPVF
jgi:hypothetical protein